MSDAEKWPGVVSGGVLRGVTLPGMTEPMVCKCGSDVFWVGVRDFKVRVKCNDCDAPELTIEIRFAPRPAEADDVEWKFACEEIK